MQCRLKLNAGPKIELLFGNCNSYYYRNIRDCYDLSDFDAEDTKSFALDFYEQFLQEETEEEAKEWCLKILEDEILKYLYEKWEEQNKPAEDYESEEDDEDEADARIDNSEASSPKTLEDFYEDYEYLEDCISELKEYSKVVMHNVWENKDISKQTFKIGQNFSVVRKFIRLERGHNECKYKSVDFTFNLFPEMYPFSAWRHVANINSNSNFYISEISKFDSSSYKLELSIEVNHGDGGIISKLKFIVKKDDVLTFKYYERDSEPYLVNATVEDIKNNEMTLGFGLFKDIG